jgi:hypothetical protein
VEKRNNDSQEANTSDKRNSNQIVQETANRKQLMKIKNEVVTDRYAIYQGDCVKVLPIVKNESIGFSVYSPPFADLYSYSDEDGDMGNCRNYAEFFTHFDFLVEQLERVMMPGRIVAVHSMDLPTQKSRDGYIGLRDFPGDLIRSFEKKAFKFCSRHCIW